MLLTPSSRILLLPSGLRRMGVELEGSEAQAVSPAATDALFTAFRSFNARFFGNRLRPVRLVVRTLAGRTLGQFEPGPDALIRFSPEAFERGEAYAADVLLHEMVHLWVNEEARVSEEAYGWHGPVFADKCSEIGERLGLQPVGASRRSGYLHALHWPINVRPRGYYDASARAE